MVILAQATLILQNHALMWKTLRRGMYAFRGKKKQYPRTYLNKNAEDVLRRTENFGLPTTLLQTMVLLGWERWGWAPLPGCNAFKMLLLIKRD